MNQQNQQDQKSREENKEVSLDMGLGGETPKGKGNWTIKIIDWGLIALLIIIVVYAQIDGRFIHETVKVIEVCQGEPVRATVNGIATNLSDVIRIG